MPQLDPHMQLGGRQDDVDALAGGRLQRLGAAQDIGRIGAAEAGDDRAVLDEFLGDRLHALEIAGGGDGEAGLEHIDAQLGQGFGHAQLLLEVHREAGRLLAVPQGGVEEDDAVVVQRAEAGMGDGHGLILGLRLVRRGRSTRPRFP